MVQRAFILCRAAVVVPDPQLHRRGVTADSRQLTRPGDFVTTVVTRAAPHYLVAEGEPLDVRRSRGGDAWQARQDGPPAAAATGIPDSPAVLLGMPTLGRPR